jgi:hypothetical protein
MDNNDIIYFVEEVFTNYDVSEKEIINYSVLLLRTNEAEENSNNENNFIICNNDKKQIALTRKGLYFKYFSSQN